MPKPGVFSWAPNCRRGNRWWRMAGWSKCWIGRRDHRRTQRPRNKPLRMKTSFVIVMGAIIAGAAGIAWNAARAERFTEAALAAGAQREARVYAQIQQAEQRLAATESEEANVRSFLAGRQKKKTSETVVPTSRPTPPATSVEALAEKLSLSPERTMTQMRRLAQQRKNIAFEHLPLISRLYRPAT